MNTVHSDGRDEASTLAPGVGPSSYLMVCEICGDESAHDPHPECAPGRGWAVAHAAATGHGQYLEVSLRPWTPGFAPPPPTPKTAPVDHSRPLDW